MSNPAFKRVRRTGVALAVGCACVALPQAAQAAAIDLGTARSFSLLGGSEVSNTGPSVFRGDVGVSPSAALPGVENATVIGAIHQNDEVAAQAQFDVGTAYDVAAAEPATDLTGQELSNRTLKSGVYGFSSSAFLSGPLPLVLDAEGNPNARFVFKVGSQLTAEVASSVQLINGASPCNVWWQVGTTAVIKSGTVMQGNVMALASITVGDAADVTGRLLARNAELTLINDTVDNADCGDGSDGRTTSGPDDVPEGTPPPVIPPPTGTPPTTTPGGPPAGTPATPAATPPGSTTPGANPGAVAPGATPGFNPVAAPVPARRTRNGRVTISRAPRESCTEGFRATVSGKMIRRVVFTMDGRRIKSSRNSPYSVLVRARPGAHKIRARVTFTDATSTRNYRFNYRACAAQVLRPRQGPSQFTG